MKSGIVAIYTTKIDNFAHFRSFTIIFDIKRGLRQKKIFKYVVDNDTIVTFCKNKIFVSGQEPLQKRPLVLTPVVYTPDPWPMTSNWWRSSAKVSSDEYGLRGEKVNKFWERGQRRDGSLNLKYLKNGWSYELLIFTIEFSIKNYI